jgi:hypothetical protein
MATSGALTFCYLLVTIVEPEITVTARGTIPVTEAPGTGYELRKDLISKLTVRSLQIP